jgi:hypothetical protein
MGAFHLGSSDGIADLDMRPSFDNLFGAMMTLFKVTTLENWGDLLRFSVAQYVRKKVPSSGALRPLMLVVPSCGWGAAGVLITYVLTVPVLLVSMIMGVVLEVRAAVSADGRQHWSDPYNATGVFAARP